MPAPYVFGLDYLIDSCVIAKTSCKQIATPELRKNTESGTWWRRLRRATLIVSGSVKEREWGQIDAIVFLKIIHQKQLSIAVKSLTPDEMVLPFFHVEEEALRNRELERMDIDAERSRQLDLEDELDLFRRPPTGSFLLNRIQNGLQRVLYWTIRPKRMDEFVTSRDIGPSLKQLRTDLEAMARVDVGRRSARVDQVVAEAREYLDPIWRPVNSWRSLLGEWSDAGFDIELDVRSDDIRKYIISMARSDRYSEFTLSLTRLVHELSTEHSEDRTKSRLADEHKVTVAGASEEEDGENDNVNHNDGVSEEGSKAADVNRGSANAFGSVPAVRPNLKHARDSNLPDGLHDPDLLVFRGKAIRLQEKPYQVLSCIWGKDSVPTTSIDSKVWGHKEGNLDRALHGIRHAISRVGYPFIPKKVAPYVIWVERDK